MTSCDAATIDPTAQIAPTAIIGNQFRPLLDGRRLKVDRDTAVGADVWIGQYATIGQGVTIGAQSILEDFVGVQPRTVIGPRVLVTSRSWIGIGVTVGHDSVIKGHIGDYSRIGAGCRIAGDLIHRQIDPSIPWDDPAGEESAPIVEDGAFVGWRAVIVGGVTIGAGAYVCAGALITRDIPAGHIAWGRNQIVHPRDWPGVLGKSPFFRDRRRPPAEALLHLEISTYDSHSGGSTESPRGKVERTFGPAILASRKKPTGRHSMRTRRRRLGHVFRSADQCAVPEQTKDRDARIAEQLTLHANAHVSTSFSRAEAVRTA